MKKIIFPFYNKERHHFLTEKWWFRTVIIIYLITFVIAPFAIWAREVNGVSWCYDLLHLYSFDFSVFEKQAAECHKLMHERQISGIPIAILGWLIAHYTIQAIFFKIVINYIVLGGKKK